MTYVNKIINKLQKAPLSIIQFNNLLDNQKRFYDNIELEKELIISNGLPLYFSNNNVVLKTTNTKIKEQVFCIVDIETTAGNAKDGQIIEIAAIKYKNNHIIESYQSFVTSNYIPPKVQEITGINLDMLVNAPSLKTVLEEFKLFLEDDVFIAHNVNFDYKFISDSLKNNDLGELFNRKLCTIDLAKRTFEAKKYGLSYLKDILDINVKNHHRAYDDALSTVLVFEYSLKKLNKDIIYTEELLEFSRIGDVIESKI